MQIPPDVIPESREIPGIVNRCRRIIAILSALVCLSAAPQRVAGQSLNLGVTWAVPSDLQQAMEDLADIRSAGVRAVRVGGRAGPELLTLADSLGLDLYQDLPLSALSAKKLGDTLGAMRTILGDVLELARRHRSLRAVGLADLSDTSDPAACDYFADLANQVNESGAGRIISYYSTRFVQSDRCASTVDLVLFHVLDVDPGTLDRLGVGGADQPGTHGIAALGRWTDLDLDHRGLNSPRSPESQARYLELVLRALDGSDGARPEVVFIHRWRDPSSVDDVFADMSQRRFGLHNSSGGARPALDVARGFATGSQTVFAFSSGDTPRPRWLWMTMLGWAVLAALGFAYAASPRMRHMVPRYFFSHGFFREAVISGRESLVAESIAVLAAVSIGAGMLSALVITEISYLPVFEVGRRWISIDTRDFVGALLDQRWTLTIILASLHALAAVGWTSILSLLSRSRSTLLPAQVMMLVIWPQWPLVSLLLVSPAVASIGPTARLGVALTVAGAAALLFLISAARTLLDYWRCTRVSPGILVAGILLHPVVVAAVVFIILVVRHSDAANYLLHLATMP